MMHHLDKSIVITNNQLEQLRNKLIKTITENLRSKDYIAEVKRSHSSSVLPSFHIDSYQTGIIIRVALKDGHNELPKFIIELISKSASQFLKKKMLNIPVEVLGEPFNDIFEISQMDLIRLLINLKPFGGPAFLDFKEETKDKDTREKMELLHPIIAKAVFPENYFNLFPKFANNKNPLMSTILFDLIKETRQNIEEIRVESGGLVSQIYSRLKKYNSVAPQKGISETVFNFDFAEIGLLIGLSNGGDALKTWSTFMNVKSFLEDQTDIGEHLTEEALIQHERVKLLVTSCETLRAIFDKIPKSEYQKILYNNFIFSGLPEASQMNEILTISKTVHQISSDNTKYFEVGIGQFEYFINGISPVLPQKANKIKNEKTPSLSSPKKEINSHGFFVTESEIPARSLTSTTKLEAKEKLEKQKVKTSKQKSGENLPPVLDNITEIAETPLERTVYFCSKNDSENPVAAKAFLLPGKFHIYICCDASHLNYENTAEIKEFQQIALRGKILARNSLGLEGIKMHGLDFLYLKLLGKSSNRMLCFAHPIEGTDCYVFRFEKILSHKECKELLTAKSTTRVEKMAKHAREGLTVSFTMEECSQDQKIALN